MTSLMGLQEDGKEDWNVLE